ncbi:MAG: helix-turn-helix domain-containing protein [Thainema sp.]
MLAATMKVRRTREWDIPSLPEQLKKAAEASGKSVVQICKDAGISTAFWYQMLKGNRDSITYETLEKVCDAIGVKMNSLGVEVD